MDRNSVKVREGIWVGNAVLTVWRVMWCCQREREIPMGEAGNLSVFSFNISFGSHYTCWLAHTGGGVEHLFCEARRNSTLRSSSQSIWDWMDIYCIYPLYIYCISVWIRLSQSMNICLAHQSHSTIAVETRTMNNNTATWKRPASVIGNVWFDFDMDLCWKSTHDALNTVILGSSLVFGSAALAVVWYVWNEWPDVCGLFEEWSQQPSAMIAMCGPMASHVRPGMINTWQV